MFDQQPASVSALHIPAHRFDTIGMLDAAIASINHQCRTNQRRNLIVAHSDDGELVLAHAFDDDGDHELADYIGQQWEKLKPSFWYTFVYGPYVMDPAAKIITPFDSVTITTGINSEGELSVHAALGVVKGDGYYPMLARYMEMKNEVPVFIFRETMTM